MSERRLRDSQRYPVGGIDRTSSVTRHVSREQKRERDSPTALLLVCMFDFVCAYTLQTFRRGESERLEGGALRQYDSMQGPLCMALDIYYTTAKVFFDPFFANCRVHADRLNQSSPPPVFFYSAFSRFSCYVRFIRMRTAREPFRASG